ncbi:WecB/TagA/CpsF family glycosyltransferase [Microcoleus sp. FACHB-53]|nr:WecB/TagA/CpsF family glycosyltransferase [Microcoleus sp. FACHB-53]MBD2130461.1 WecB/TagA/CpsF family glycosyltransferase [Microcoleus sp. FACHB-1]
MAELDEGKRNVLGVRVDAVNYEAAVHKIIAAARQGKKLSVSALAVHGVMTGVLDETHRYRLNRLDLVCPDGQPVRWAVNLLYKLKLPDRVCGPVLMLKICERAAQEGLPIYLYGSRPEILEALSKNLCDRFPKLIIAGSQPSRFRQVSIQEKQQIVEQIRQSGAAMVFAGLGCPRQEVWVYEYSQDLAMPVMAVGAAFDFHAGRISQAPVFMQRWGLEWFYRLMQEPTRLWRRYVFLNPLYISLFILQFFKVVYFNPANAKPPREDMRYG